MGDFMYAVCNATLNIVVLKFLVYFCKCCFVNCIYEDDTNLKSKNLSSSTHSVCCSCIRLQVSLLNVPFVALCVLGVVSNVRMKFFFSRLISLVVTIIVLSKMIYQIAYLNHGNYQFKCPNGNGQVTGNNAEWFGLYKASPEFGLMGLLKKYIIYMVIATLHAVIALRQNQMRRLKGTENDPLPKVAFPHVGREDAEKKLGGMVKYLFNYGFYKFGYEICLVALVSTITYRQDIVAVAYSVWLMLLLLFRREKNAHIWGILQVFILTSILVQYVILVEFPPSMCIGKCN